mmetsp:Transcript_20756/g.44940  ORF Transcript_20756/g.44940 Transcript_20756/m.44940 type:complete len:80 (-) Transcript_20756:512-751(-)
MTNQAPFKSKIASEKIRQCNGILVHPCTKSDRDESTHDVWSMAFDVFDDNRANCRTTHTNPTNRQSPMEDRNIMVNGAS